MNLWICLRSLELGMSAFQKSGQFKKVQKLMFAPHSINSNAQVGELDRYTISRRLTSQALVWKIENDKSSNLQALSKLGLRTLHMVSRPPEDGIFDN
jgi:hypothetical protein